MKNEANTETEELFIEELGEVRGGGSNLLDSLLKKGPITTLALGEEGPNPFLPPDDSDRPAPTLPWLHAAATSVPSADQ